MAAGYSVAEVKGDGYNYRLCALSAAAFNYRSENREDTLNPL